MSHLANGFHEAMRSSREWQNKFFTDDSPSNGRRRFMFFDPPIEFVRYMIFCRLVRNAAHVTADPTCQNLMVRDATGFLEYHGVERMKSFFKLCRVVMSSTGGATDKSNSMCPNFSLTYEMARIIIERYIHILGRNSRSVDLQNFLDTISGIENYEFCQTQDQKDQFKKIHKDSFHILSRVLEPPPKGLCIEDHVRAIIDKWADDVRDNLRLVNCDIPN